MRGLLGGILSGGMVSVLALSVASLVSEQPAGSTPPVPPLVDAPEVEVDPEAVDVATEGGLSSPVGSLSVNEPQAPALPDAEAALEEPDSPISVATEQSAPRADTDPLDEPQIATIEGTLSAPDTSESANIQPDIIDPVLPNPQAVAPQTPVNEANLTVSTAPATPVIVEEPDVEVDTSTVNDEGEGETGKVVIQGSEEEETFVFDVGADGVEQPQPVEENPDAGSDAVVDTNPDTEAEETVIASQTGPRIQFQGGENTLLADRDTGVTIRRPGNDAAAVSDTAQETVNALVDFAAVTEDTGGRPLMSIVLIDDGSMSAAAAALSGLPFNVTIGLDPAMEGVEDLMAQYREDGFEVAVLAKVPEGAVPSDVEITFESVFSRLPETVAVLDIGEGGLQADRDVTEQAMDILAAQGRGFITVSQGLNFATRAAEQAGVHAGVVYRELDSDDQDARVIRRFVDQAAFRARQESGVILIGRVRPDTISALILWGTANQDDLVSVVPISAVLLAE